MSFAQPEPGPGTKDNSITNPPGDHDEPYTFGRLPAYLESMSQWQRARMLIMKARLGDTLTLRNRYVRPPRVAKKKETTE